MCRYKLVVFESKGILEIVRKQALYVPDRCKWWFPWKVPKGGGHCFRHVLLIKLQINLNIWKRWRDACLTL